MSYPPPVTPDHVTQPPQGDWRPPPTKNKALPILLSALVVTVGVVVALAYALVNKGGVEPTGVAQPVAAPVASLAPSVTAGPTSPATAAGQAKLKMGQAHKFTADGDRASVTALDHRRYDGYEAVQVRTCNVGQTTFPATTVPWFLSYDGGEQLVDITVTGGGLLSPAFPERELEPGKCARGWITYEPPASGRPDGVEYRIEGHTSARWEF